MHHQPTDSTQLKSKDDLCFCEKVFQKKFGDSKNLRTFAFPFGKYAEIAQLVEHNLAKVGVASSSLVFRSKRSLREIEGTEKGATL